VKPHIIFIIGLIKKAEFQEVKMYNRILAPLDGSKMSECSLSHIKEIGTGCHVAEVVLLTVLESLTNPFFWPSSKAQVDQVVAEQENARKGMRQKAENYLNGINENLRLAGLSVQNVIIEERDNMKAADIILDYAQNNDVDLIVLSTHGRSGIARWSFGSVADKVVRHATVPVLTVAPEGCRPFDAPLHHAKV
jgi:nucleotide-binding universal stress UspA family protein